MWRNGCSNRRFFLAICLSVLILAAATSLFVWHALTQPPTPPQATCGAILQSGPPQAVSTDAHMQQVESCFYHAFQQCVARTMEVSENRVDTGSDTLYWPHLQGNTCQIIVQSSSFGPGSDNSTKTETCQGVIPKNGGLLFQRCGKSGDGFFLAG